MVINKTIQVYGKQRQFLESKAMWRCFVGGIGSGKSYIGALDMIRRAKPNRLYLVTAPTYPMLSDSSFRSFAEVAQTLECVLPLDIKTSAPPSIKMRTGAEVLFRSTDNPEMLRGPNLSGVWMDEASLSKREAFDILIGRLRQGGEMGWLTATFTPKGKQHWTYREFGLGAADTELIHASSDENPFLPPTFVANIRKKYSVQQIKQELGGAFIDGGGNHYHPDGWPRYVDTGDAYRIGDGSRWRHVRKAECSRLVALDWAMGKPKKGAVPEQAGELTGDCTAFAVADMTDDGLLFLLHAVNERIPMESNAPRLAELCRRWRPIVVAGDDDNMSVTMLLECRRFRDIPEITCLPISSKNKLIRSQATIVRAERGMVYLPERELPWVEELSDQLAAFTGADGEPDDLADAIAILGRLADEFRPGEDRDEDEAVLGAAGYSSDVYGGEW
jgi:predicted phage terminase large subunit-like protein